MGALDRVGLADVANHRVGTYSRGMRQRLGLAEILMKDARIAILDEPTSGLDPQATAELLAMIRSLKREGVAVLISSHLLERVQHDAAGLEPRHPVAHALRPLEAGIRDQYGDAVALERADHCQ